MHMTEFYYGSDEVTQVLTKFKSHKTKVINFHGNHLNENIHKLSDYVRLLIFEQALLAYLEL